MEDIFNFQSNLTYIVYSCPDSSSNIFYSWIYDSLTRSGDHNCETGTMSLLLQLESRRAAGTVSLPKAFNFFRTCCLSWETELLLLHHSFTQQALLASARHYGPHGGVKKVIRKILMPSGSLWFNGRDRCSRRSWGDFPGGPMVKTSPSSAGGVCLIPGWGTKIPRTPWPKTKQNKT